MRSSRCVLNSSSCSLVIFANSTGWPNPPRRPPPCAPAPAPCPARAGPPPGAARRPPLAALPLLLELFLLGFVPPTFRPADLLFQLGDPLLRVAACPEAAALAAPAAALPAGTLSTGT